MDERRPQQTLSDHMIDYHMYIVESAHNGFTCFDRLIDYVEDEYYVKYDLQYILNFYMRYYDCRRDFMVYAQHYKIDNALWSITHNFGSLDLNKTKSILSEWKGVWNDFKRQQRIMLYLVILKKNYLHHFKLNSKELLFLKNNKHLFGIDPSNLKDPYTIDEIQNVDRSAFLKDLQCFIKHDPQQHTRRDSVVVDASLAKRIQNVDERALNFACVCTINGGLQSQSDDNDSISIRVTDVGRLIHYITTHCPLTNEREEVVKELYYNAIGPRLCKATLLKQDPKDIHYFDDQLFKIYSHRYEFTYIDTTENDPDHCSSGHSKA